MVSLNPLRNTFERKNFICFFLIKNPFLNAFGTLGKLSMFPTAYKMFLKSLITKSYTFTVLYMIKMVFFFLIIITYKYFCPS